MVRRLTRTSPEGSTPINIKRARGLPANHPDAEARRRRVIKLIGPNKEGKGKGLER